LCLCFSFHCTLQVLDASVRTVFRHAHARSVTAHTAVCSPTTAAVGPTRCAGQLAVLSGELACQSVSQSVPVLVRYIPTVLRLAALRQAPALRTPQAHPSPLMKLKGRGGEVMDIPSHQTSLSSSRRTAVTMLCGLGARLCCHLSASSHPARCLLMATQVPLVR
jgi:hypothetical protein